MPDGNFFGPRALRKKIRSARKFKRRGARWHLSHTLRAVSRVSHYVEPCGFLHLKLDFLLITLADKPKD